MKFMPSTKKISASNNSLAVPSQDKKIGVENIYKKYGYNDAVQLSLRNFSSRRYGFQKRLELSGKYIGGMEDIFSRRGLPIELVYLPLVESGFDLYAYSHRKAAGPWQLMPATANTLGLKVDWWVDERRDPVKSTKAAAKYLKYLYEKFGSWNLALAAYNAGEGRIQHALRKSRRKDFWSIRETTLIKRETKNYVPSYIAAAAIAAHPERFGFKNISYQKPPRYDEVFIDRSMDFDVIARFAGVRASDIRDLNPELRRWCTPPDTLRYKLRIPKGSREKFLANVSKSRGDELDYVRFYEVREGDTVAKIAKTFGTSIHEIISRNDLGRRALIIAGRRILIPLERQLDKFLKKITN